MGKVRFQFVPRFPDDDVSTPNPRRYDWEHRQFVFLSLPEVGDLLSLARSHKRFEWETVRDQRLYSDFEGKPQVRRLIISRSLAPPPSPITSSNNVIADEFNNIDGLSDESNHNKQYEVKVEWVVEEENSEGTLDQVSKIEISVSEGDFAVVQNLMDDSIPHLLAWSDVVQPMIPSNSSHQEDRKFSHHNYHDQGHNRSW